MQLPSLAYQTIDHWKWFLFDKFKNKMIAQKKDKIEYVDEFRKISTLEKLPTIISSINNIFDEEAVKDSNNKFMRLRK